MDKVSDLIEGAKLSGRYRTTREINPDKTTAYHYFRFITTEGRRLCPLEVAQMERFGRLVRRIDSARDAKILGIPVKVAKMVMHEADANGEDGITCLREMGY